MKPILITGAEDTELNILLDKLENKKEDYIHGYNFYKGFFYNYPVIIVRTDVGIINATISTTIAIQEFDPCIVINQGTAGSHVLDFTRGDLVIAEKVAMMNSYVTPCKEGKMEVNALEWNIRTFADNKQIINTDEKLLNMANLIQNEYLYGNIYNGVIASGDMFNRETKRIKWFNKKFDTVCEEMEGFAVYSVAEKFKVPVIGFRVISNNELTGEKYDTKYGECSQEFTYCFVKRFINEYEKGFYN